ncbi:hypothetical protein KP509_1Z096400 [Ceratopteris richardii]|nr:hypothetical protein KP509_1Z096400 [Ceratopteris richardii]
MDSRCSRWTVERRVQSCSRWTTINRDFPRWTVEAHDQSRFPTMDSRGSGWTAERPTHDGQRAIAMDSQTSTSLRTSLAAQFLVHFTTTHHLSATTDLSVLVFFEKVS